MLTMPNVSAPASHVSRPSLVVESVRPVANPRAIEPTTAVSKERSRMEKPVSDSSAAGTAVVYTLTGAVSNGSERTQNDLTLKAERDALEAEKAKEPPAEKSEIQKAMDQQIKDLLVNVWKASAKAVDFLLKREDPQSGKPMGLLEVAAFLGSDEAKSDAAKLAEALSPAATAKAASAATTVDSGVVSYSAQGERLSERSSVAGQLINVLA